MEEKIVKYLREYKNILIKKAHEEKNLYLFEKYYDKVSDIVYIIYCLEDKEKGR